MNKRKPIKGEKLCLVRMERREVLVLSCIVSRVGRKYFYIKVEDWAREIQFWIDTWREKTEYSPTYILYETEQRYNDIKEKGRILDLFSFSFKWGGDKNKYTLPQLREAAKILKIDI